jgi:hypothetical protein
LARGEAEFVVLLRRTVDDNESIDPRLFCVAQERFDSIDVNWIEVAHQHEGRFAVIGAKGANHLQRSAKRLPGFESPQSGGLDLGAIRHRIGEWHSKLDDVGAGLRQPSHDGERSLGVGVPGHDVCHECGAALRREALKAMIDALRHRLLVSMRLEFAKP